LWPSIVQEVHILPNEVIDPVILFFSQLETIRNFVEDMRSDRFVMLEPARKAAMYRDYVRMVKFLVLLAGKAEGALARSLGVELPVQQLSRGPVIPVRGRRAGRGIVVVPPVGDHRLIKSSRNERRSDIPAFRPVDSGFGTGIAL
jgi:hypothetical protein